MSRSYKKNPVWKMCVFGDGPKFEKKQANKRIRQVLRGCARKQYGDHVGDGGHFKRFYEQWDIWEHRMWESKEEALVRFMEMEEKDFETMEWERTLFGEIKPYDPINEWAKYHHRK